MEKREEDKRSGGGNRPGHGGGRRNVVNGHRPRRRFIISPKAHAAVASRPTEPGNGASKVHAPGQVKAGQPNGSAAVVSGRATHPAVDLAETIKTLVQLAREHGHVTYDDINDILPDGLSPEDLDELYMKLRNLDVEIVDHAEVERAKPAEPEGEEDSRLEVLDDPVRMYMNQMGKVPLLTREQEGERCKTLADAQSEMKPQGHA